jgi:hypothetical protein
MHLPVMRRSSGRQPSTNVGSGLNHAKCTYARRMAAKAERAHCGAVTEGPQSRYCRRSRISGNRRVLPATLLRPWSPVPGSEIAVAESLERSAGRMAKAGYHGLVGQAVGMGLAQPYAVFYSYVRVAHAVVRIGDFSLAMARPIAFRVASVAFMVFAVELLRQGPLMNRALPIAQSIRRIHIRR